MDGSVDGAATITGDDRADTRKLAVLTMVTGAVFIVGALGSVVVDVLWFAMLVSFALLAYVIPKWHAHQAPDDGPAGTWAARLVLVGAAIILTLGIVSGILDAVGYQGDPGWTGPLWAIGILSFLIGVVTFSIGSMKARRVPQAAPLLMLIGLACAIVIDMLTGAFFEAEPVTTQWGFYIGVPVFGLGLGWMGYTLWESRRAARRLAV